MCLDVVHFYTYYSVFSVQHIWKNLKIATCFRMWDVKHPWSVVPNTSGFTFWKATSRSPDIVRVPSTTFCKGYDLLFYDILCSMDEVAELFNIFPGTWRENKTLYGFLLDILLFSAVNHYEKLNRFLRNDYLYII